MAKHHVVLCIVIALTLAMGIASLADVPRHISFQGKLHDNAGNPLTSQYDVTFRIYSTSSGGTALWSETMNVQCENGLYNVILGKTNPITLNFDGQYYLGVQVTGDSELSPRYELTSVPGAFRAAVADDADKLDGKDADEFAASVHQHDDRYYTETELKTNDGTVNESGDPVSWFKIKDIPAGFADGTDEVGAAGGVSQINQGTGITVTDPTGPTATVAANIGTGADQVAAGNHNHDARYFTETELKTDDGNAPNTGSNMMHWNNLWGVPAGFADGTDEVGASGGVSQINEGTGITVTNPTGPTATVAADIGTGADQVAAGNHTHHSLNAADDNPTNAVSVDNAGKVGIGTATPAQKLDIAGTAQMTGFKMPTGASNGYVLTSDGSGVGTWQAAGGGIGGSGTDNFLPRWSGAGNLENSIAYQSDAGKIGIGTTSPDALLHVQGSAFDEIKIESSVSYGTASVIAKTNDNMNDYLKLYKGGPTTSGTTAGEIPLANLSSLTSGIGAGPLMLQVMSSDPMYFVTDNQERMRITSDGKVGIGTTNPSLDLHVGNGGGLALQNEFGGVASIEFRNTEGTGLNSQISSDNTGMTLWTDSGRDIVLSAGSSVGIGTTNPSLDLHVGNGGGLALQNEFGGVASIEFRNTEGTGLNSQISSDITGMTLWTDSGRDIVLSSGANVGVGTTSPEHKLHVVGQESDHAQNGHAIGYFKNTVASADAGAVYGECANTDFYGYGGFFKGGFTGVEGRVSATGNHHYYGISGSVSGGTGTNYGVYGYASGGNTNWAGYFSGDVYISGDVLPAAGSSKIDHPLDPENKYLSHAFVESPDMMNVYNGNVTLDANGEAIVELPDYFQAFNRDFRYQLTAIGAPGPNLYIAQKISGNRFKIGGGKPGMEVSWQVTGIRQDAYADAHRIPVEEEKSIEERGKYLHPTDLGQPETMGIEYERSQKIQNSGASRSK